MGGMIAIAFAANHDGRVDRDVRPTSRLRKPDVYRATLFRVWRRISRSMPSGRLLRPRHDAGRRRRLLESGRKGEVFVAACAR